MNDTVREIVGILESGRPELQVAAAQVLGELKPRDAAVVKALENAVGRSHVLGRYALDALAKLGGPEALKALVRCLTDHDALVDQAVHLLADLGQPTHALLAEAFAQAPTEKRGAFLTILARQLSKEGMPVFVHALLMPELAEMAARLLIAGAAQFQPALQKMLTGGLARYLEDAVPETCLVQIVGVLGKIDPVGSRPAIVKFTDARHTPAVRAAAMRAMHGGKLTAVQVKAFLALLEDPLQKDVHDAVRDLLGSLTEWPEGMAVVLKRLLAARQPEQRLFALRALRGVGGVEMVRTALKYLQHEDVRFRDAAALALSTNRQAIEPVTRLLTMSKDGTQAQVLSAILVQLGQHIAPRQLRTLAEKAVKLMAARTAAGDALFDVVVAIDGARIAPFLLDKAIRLRRSKRYAEALHILAKLASTPHLDLEGRYQLALTRLLQDIVRPSFDAGAPGNATMGFFAALVRDGFPLVERLRKESLLPAEVMLKLATYFAEAVGPERRFGSELLQHLATRAKGRAGEEARLALRTVGR